MMNLIKCTLFFLLFTTKVLAQTPQYTPADSIKVMYLLQKGTRLKKDANAVLFFARELRGIPYVAKTLERNKTEQLIINLRQLDCTTYVENVLALTLCHQNKRTAFTDFCQYLRQLRYREGRVSYVSRLHYFSEWIAANTRVGIIREIQSPDTPFIAVQRLDVSYMSTHPQFYPQLVGHPDTLRAIQAMEKLLTGRTYRYIPKSQIVNTALLRRTIHDGDIIALVTRIAGLDTSHLGIAVWHRDGLHLLNASSVHHRVVEEPMILRSYMQRHPSQIGIRVVRIKNGTNDDKI